MRNALTIAVLLVSGTAVFAAAPADPGRAIVAWKITSGSFEGVPLDGLTVAAAIADERNPGMRETTGEEPAAVKAIITVDPRATPAQRDALVRFVRAMSRGLIAEVVRVDTAPIRFATSLHYVEVSVPESMQGTDMFAH